MLTLPALTLAGAQAQPARHGPPSPTASPPTAPTPATPPPEILHLALQAQPTDAPPTILAASPATWPSTCLGLAPPGAVCAQALTHGWILTLGAPHDIPTTIHVGGGIAIVSPGP